MNNETIIFLHIPKTAGTTLLGILWRYYQDERIYMIDGSINKLPDFINLAAGRKRQIRLLTGHINYGIHEYLPQPATYFTILREPIDLVVSYYYYLKGEITHPHHPLVTTNGMSLPEFLESRVSEHVCNTQTRLLSGKANSGEFYPCTTADLEIAKRRLENSFSVVGLTEAFDETLLLLQQVYGWENIYYARMNVTRKRPSRPEIDIETRAAIETANQLDLELYQFAAKLFEEQLEKRGPQFKRKLKTFKKRNRRYYLYYYLRWHWRRQRDLAIRRILHRLRTWYSRLA